MAMRLCRTRVAADAPVGRESRSVILVGHRGPTLRAATAILCVCMAILPACHREEPDTAAVEFVFGRTGLGPGEFSYPRGIAVSPVDGCIFVVDRSPTGRVQRFSAKGEYEHQWSMPDAANGKPTGLYIDQRNRIWVADTHYQRVIVYDREGVELFRFGEEGRGPGQFIFPTSVAIDREGYVYVAEYGGNDRINKFTPDLQYQSCFANQGSGEGSVERPYEIVFDNEDKLWVTDSCHHRICRYDRNGKFLFAFGSPGSEPHNLNYPIGLILEKSGTMLVADRGNNRIVRFDRQGRFLGSWGKAGREPGQMLQPWGVAVSRKGLVYCLDSWNNRVQAIDW